jgi:hypothetical protein
MAKNSGRIEKNKLSNLESVNPEILDKADLKRSNRNKSVSFQMKKQLDRNDKM